MKRPEEIKKGLECCNTYNDCQSCPYDDKVEKGWGCCVQRNADALAYIHQLESKLAEYEKPLVPLKVGYLLKENPVWLEYNSGPVEICELSVWYNVYCAYFIGDEDEEYLTRAGYNKIWRCWPRKPTDEEREAAKWDE